MKIHVRRRHIRNGMPIECSQCPVALAVAEKMGVPIYVSYEFIDGLDRRVPLPRSARRFIQRFDAGKPVKPFAFVLK